MRVPLYALIITFILSFSYLIGAIIYYKSQVPDIPNKSILYDNEGKKYMVEEFYGDYKYKIIPLNQDSLSQKK